MPSTSGLLDGKEIPTPRGKSWWDRTTIWAILKNPAYKGAAAFGKTRSGPRRPQLRTLRGQVKIPRRTGTTYDTDVAEKISIAVPAIVSEELFSTVEQQLSENRQRGRERKRGASYLLQGLLECESCGYAYYGKKVSRSAAKGKVPYAYYRCIGTDAYRFGGKRVCHNKQLRTDRLDQAVWVSSHVWWSGQSRFASSIGSTSPFLRRKLAAIAMKKFCTFVGGAITPWLAELVTP